MSEVIICLTEKELVIAGKFNSDSSEVSYDNLTFTKGANFSVRLKEQALKYCKNVADTNLKRLLVEGQYSLTVWIQKQVLQQTKTEELDVNKASKIDNPEVVSPPSTSSSLTNSTNVRKYRGQVYEISQPPVSPTSSPTISEKPQPLLQKIIRKYRGRAYDETVVDSSGIESTSKKPRRKYRGQYID